MKCWKAVATRLPYRIWQARNTARQPRDSREVRGAVMNGIRVLSRQTTLSTRCISRTTPNQLQTPARGRGVRPARAESSLTSKYLELTEISEHAGPAETASRWAPTCLTSFSIDGIVGQSMLGCIRRCTRQMWRLRSTCSRQFHSSYLFPTTQEAACRQVIAWWWDGTERGLAKLRFG